MQLKPHELAAHAKRSLAPVYLLAGDEPLIVQECADALREAARQAGHVEREALVLEPGFDWSQLRSAGQNLSLFAQKRRIELYLDRSPGVEGSTALREYTAALPADVILIVLAGSLDKDARKSAWVTALEKVGVMVYAFAIKDAEFERWLAARAQRLGLQLAPQALAELAARTEGNLLACAQELDKLKLLFPDGKVDLPRIREAVADSARFGNFDLVDKALAGDAAGALRALDRLREEGEEPVSVLGSLHWTLEGLARVGAAQDRRGNLDAAYNASRIRFDKRASFSQAAKRLGLPELEQLLSQAAHLDRMAKSEAAGRVWLELVKLCASLGGTRLPAAAGPRHGTGQGYRA